MAVRKSTQNPETTAQHSQTSAGNKSTPGDEKTAGKLSQGLTLVPYWGVNEAGRRVPLSCWVRLRPGESISQAASRLTALAQRKG